MPSFMEEKNVILSSKKGGWAFEKFGALWHPQSCAKYSCFTQSQVPAVFTGWKRAYPWLRLLWKTKSSVNFEGAID